MAVLISIATGNFTAAGTWAVADTTSASNSSANNTALTTSYVASSTFTPGIITIDAILVRVASRASSPTGTMSVELYNSTGAASVAGTEVTINVSDIVEGTSVANGGCSWVCLKFAAPVTLLAATAYSVRAKTSSSSQVNLYRNATSNNWTRYLRTTTTGAPAASDNMIVIGEWTAAATSTTFTVTLDNTATTTFGFFYSCLKGIATCGTAASTNYYLKHGTLAVFAGGTLTSAALPSTSTFTIDCASTTAAEFGLNLFGTTSLVGPAKSNWKSNMTVNKVAGNTVITVADTTGWAVGDQLAFPSTTRTASQSEKKTILTVDSATQVTLSAGLTNDHLGTSPTVCEVMNLTRNIIIRGTSATNTGFVAARTTGANTFENVEFHSLGSSGVVAIDVQTTTGTFSMDGCILRDCTNATTTGISVTATSGSNVSFLDVGVYSVTSVGLNIVATSGVNNFENIYCIGCGGGGIVTADCGSVYDGLKAAGNTGNGIYFNESGGGTFTTCQNIESHSNSSLGIRWINCNIGTLSTLNIWRNGSSGLSLQSLVGTPNLIFDTLTAFGNGGENISLVSTGIVSGSVVFKNLTLNGGTTLVTSVGIAVADNFASYYIEDSSFGATTAHTSGDINASSSCGCNLYCYNTTLSSSTEILNQTNIGKTYGNVGIVSVKHDGVAGAQKSWSRLGTISSDTTIYNTASPSIRLAPLSASLKLPSAYRVIPVKSGETVTVTVYVRKSYTVSGDSATYNGNQPRLMLRKNLETGITADTVLDTMTAAVGSWEALTATTASASADGAFEFFVDCDGTTGWVNVDDFTTTYVLDSSGMNYWNYGRPAVDGPDPEDGAGGGGGSGGSWTF